MRRREFIRQSAAAAAGAAAGIAVPAQAQPSGMDPGVKWSKAPCRFCGTGCGVTVAVKDNRVIATQGDPQSKVHKFENNTVNEPYFVPGNGKSAGAWFLWKAAS